MVPECKINIICICRTQVSFEACTELIYDLVSRENVFESFQVICRQTE